MSLTLFRTHHAEQPAPEPARRGAKPRIGVALGAGVARGWAHIGALRELVDMGIVPDVVVGASIGAVVGGCYAAGRLDELEDFALSLTKRSVFNLVDVSFRGGGLMGGRQAARAARIVAGPAAHREPAVALRRRRHRDAHRPRGLAEVGA